MKPGNKLTFLSILFFLSFYNLSKAEDKITSTSLINIDEIQPSFEDLESNNEVSTTDQTLKKKGKDKFNNNSSHAVLIGLDKITAKSSKIYVNLNEVTKYGKLEIKILKCGKVKRQGFKDDVAYMQVKDLSKNENDKVFIYNGWTFASDPNVTPFDHAIYDLQLVNCKV